MGRQRLTPATAIAVLSLCVLPSGAYASSTLLSGYGGPGEGNQAIIGSTLIGGGNGSSGGGTGSTASQTTSNSGSIEASATRPASGSHPKGESRTHRKGSGSSAGDTSGTGVSAYTPIAATTHESSGSALGLNGADLLYIVLALAVLGLTAVLTVRLARGPTGPSGAQ